MLIYVGHIANRVLLDPNRTPLYPKLWAITCLTSHGGGGAHLIAIPLYTTLVTTKILELHSLSLPGYFTQGTPFNANHIPVWKHGHNVISQKKSFELDSCVGCSGETIWQPGHQQQSSPYGCRYAETVLFFSPSLIITLFLLFMSVHPSRI